VRLRRLGDLHHGDVDGLEPGWSGFDGHLREGERREGRRVSYLRRGTKALRMIKRREKREGGREGGGKGGRTMK